MTVEIFENRKNSLPHYIEYLTKLASVKLESAIDGEDGAMMEYNQVSLILQDLCDISEKQQFPIGMKQASSKEALNHLFNKNK
jgi:hypothetical protein